jgi:hypothetical protein
MKKNARFQAHSEQPKIELIGAPAGVRSTVLLLKICLAYALGESKLSRTTITPSLDGRSNSRGERHLRNRVALDHPYNNSQSPTMLTK